MLKSLNIALEKMERRNAPWIRVLILLKSLLKLVFFSGSSWFFSPGGDVEMNTKNGVGKVLLYFPHFHCYLLSSFFVPVAVLGTGNNKEKEP